MGSSGLDPRITSATIRHYTSRTQAHRIDAFLAYQADINQNLVFGLEAPNEIGDHTLFVI